jgi:dimethylargininase
MSLQALVRDVSASLADCELTHLERAPIDVARARQEHRAYCDALRGLGVDVTMLPPLPELPDAVFVEDTVVALPELAVMARSGAASRRGEVASVAEVLEGSRRVVALEAPAELDGGDVLRVGETLFVGDSSRTNAAGREQLARLVEAVGYRVVAVPIHGCLHLKSAACRIGERTLLVQPAWVDPAGFGDLATVEIDPSEPFAANAVWVPAQGGLAVLHAEEHGRTRSRMEQRGVRVVPVPAGELAKAEGGVTCCSILLD